MNIGLFAQGSNAALIAFVIYVLGVFGLAYFSNRLLQSRNFLSEYFLGSRSLGVWAFALTFAATSASGGSFTGFPSKIYTHGWVLGLWIGSYIVVPICAMGLLGKRINQVSRISGAITVPDVVRDRFGSPFFGLASVALIVFFMSFNLVAQFKSGSEILRTLLQDVEAFKTTVGWVATLKPDTGMLGAVDAAYLLCLLTFAVAVIVYTTYGGFHAVVWTDVMQGIVMVIGVMVMLPLALWQVGGLRGATEQMSRMTPPKIGLADMEWGTPLDQPRSFPGPWFVQAGSDPYSPRLFRVAKQLELPAGKTRIEHVPIVEITTPEEINNQLKRLEKSGEFETLPLELHKLRSRSTVWLNRELETLDSNQVLAEITLLKGYRYGDDQKGVYVSGPGPKPPSLPDAPGTMELTTDQLTAAVTIFDLNGVIQTRRQLREGRGRFALGAGDYQIEVASEGFPLVRSQFTIVSGEAIDKTVTLQGAEAAEPIRPVAASSNDGFLPLSLAISFFFMWAISGTGQPSTMVRLMAFKNTTTLRRSIFTVAWYYSLIYFPLVVIFCCARVLLPGMDLESDRIMPQMAVTLTAEIGQGWLAGLLVAAPFAAVMSTVDSFLLLISSALVRDIYQRNINPEVSERNIKMMSYLFTLLVGIAATLGAVNPPQFLQDIIVYTGSGLAACFLGPMIFALYWPRANSIGCIAGMAAGFLAHLSMYITGWLVNGSFYAPYQLFDFNPIIVGLVVSFTTLIIVTLLTPKPPQELVTKYFCRKVESA